MSANLSRMKSLRMAVAGVVGLSIVLFSSSGALDIWDKQPQHGTDARARELIQKLKLDVLPKESGYLGIIGRSAQMVSVDGRSLAVQSQNYYMLTRERPINYLHWLAAGRHTHSDRGRSGRLLHLSSRWARGKADARDGPGCGRAAGDCRPGKLLEGAPIA